MIEEPYLDEDEDFIDWDCEDCETCKRVVYHTVHREENDIAEKWLCAGKIIRPDNPKDLHEAMNQVRFCIADFSTEDKSKLWNWTPYEALTVSTILQHAVRAILNNQHNDEFQRLQESLSTPNHTQLNENLVDSQSDSATNSKEREEVNPKRS